MRGTIKMKLKGKDKTIALLGEFLKDENFEVRRDGVIWSKKRRRNIVRTKMDKKNKRLEFTYQKRNFKLSHALYMKFVGKINPDPYKVIVPIDGNWSNITADNLKQISRTKHEGSKKHNGNYVLSQQLADNIRLIYSTGDFTYKELVEKYGISKGHVSEIINNKIWVDNPLKNKVGKIEAERLSNQFS